MTERLTDAARRWARHLKLGPHFTGIEDHAVPQIYEAWRDFKHYNRLPEGASLTSMGPGEHGQIRFSDTFQCDRILISSDDPKERQLITLTHEGLHRHFGRHQPDHDQLHTLAGGLSTSVFPKYERGETTLFDRDEIDLLQRMGALSSQGAARLTDIDQFGDSEEIEDGEVILSDAAQRMTAQTSPRRPKMAGYAQSGMPKSLIVDNAASAAIMSQYRGWIVPYLIKAYEAQTLILPLRGVYRATPLFDYSGWKASSLKAWWDQLITGLDGATTGKATKAYQKRHMGIQTGATAANTAPHHSLAFGVPGIRTIGMIVRVSDNMLKHENCPAHMSFFSGLTNRARSYLMGFHGQDKGVSEFLVLLADNDRGQATISGVDTSTTTPVGIAIGIQKGMQPSAGVIVGPTNMNGAIDTVIPNLAGEAIAMADQIFPQLRMSTATELGAQVAIETINYRDIQ